MVSAQDGPCLFTETSLAGAVRRRQRRVTVLVRICITGNDVTSHTSMYIPAMSHGIIFPAPAGGCRMGWDGMPVPARLQCDSSCQAGRVRDWPGPCGRADGKMLGERGLEPTRTRGQRGPTLSLRLLAGMGGCPPLRPHASRCSLSESRSAGPGRSPACFSAVLAASPPPLIQVRGTYLLCGKGTGC